MLTITPIPAFSDNYFWLIHDPYGHAVVIDPGNTEAVLAALTITHPHLILDAILITHHHWDHTGGINGLLQHYDIPVYGPQSAKIPQITHSVNEGDRIELLTSASLIFKVMNIPGHTFDHIAYHATINDEPVLFCGDTVFSAGCGRVFDGTHQQLNQSLQKINQLAANTQLFSAHEFTMNNLHFSQMVEPNNVAIQQRKIIEHSKLARGEITIPSTLATERKTNPFLRLNEKNVIHAVNHYWEKEWSDEQDIFNGLRRWKDQF